MGCTLLPRVLHGRPQKSTAGMPGIPCETSSLYKDTTIQAQLGQAKQDEIKEVRQQRLVEKKMAHSLVFHVVLTIDVRPDGEVALNITADKPRPNAARAQQQSDKIAQLKAVKKKLRATTLDTWVATAQTSGSVLKLSLFHTIAPSIRVSLLSFHRLIFLLWKAAKNLDKAPPSGFARARHLRPAAAALPLPRHHHLHLQAAAAPPPPPPREQRGRRLPRLIPNRKEASFKLGGPLIIKNRPIERAANIVTMYCNSFILHSPYYRFIYTFPKSIKVSFNKKKFLQGHGIIKSRRVLFGGISKRSEEFLGDIIKRNFLKMSQSSPPPRSQIVTPLITFSLFLNFT